MSYIIRRKVKNAVYVYECTSYRNKAGKPRSRQKYLGKLDSDGILITKKRKLPAQIREVKIITRRFIFEPKVQDFSPDITSKKDTPIPTNSGSTGRPATAEKIAASGENTIDARVGDNITDARTKPGLTFPLKYSAHNRGMNTTEARSVMDRKPKSLIA